MKHQTIFRLMPWFMAACVLGLAGCSTPMLGGGGGASSTIKVRGVYTTLSMPKQQLDLAGSGYSSYRKFSAQQTPAAVVIGYGEYVGNVNYPQAFQLRLIESASGTVIQTLDSQVYADMAAVIDLPIRKSGNYQLQLVIQDKVADTWDFAVEREISADTPDDGQSPAYAKGEFSVNMVGMETSDAFIPYDDSLLWALNAATLKEFRRANADDFAQMPAGHVTVQFDLSARGEVTSPQIVENTLSNAIGQFFLRALQNGAPYKAWPAEARAAAGGDTRAMKVTFRYD